MKRRTLLQIAGLAAVAGWVWGAPRLPRLWERAPMMEPMMGARPFRLAITDGAISAPDPLFTGLEDRAPVPESARIAVDTNPCAALFGRADLAIAVFSDIRCPNCPGMEAEVQRVAAEHGLPVIHHELPLLSRASDQGARALVAGKRQGGTAALRAALVATPGPLPDPRILALAQASGLDGQRLLRDMRDPAVDDQLSVSRALARRLGLIGTPATVIGRTVILGTLPARQIARIIAAERSDDFICEGLSWI